MGFWAQDHTAGIHDQQLNEMCCHIPEGKLASDLCTEINSHTFTPETDKCHTHLKITLEDRQLSIERSPKTLGVIMDPSLCFHRHCNYMAYMIDKRNNIPKALAGSFWGQNRTTILFSYNAWGKYITSYAAPIWSTHGSDSSFKKIQTAQNAA